MAQVFERGGKWYARFMHEGKDYARSTGIAVATRSKKAAAESKAEAEAELSRMLAEIRGRESVEALFSRLTEALDRLPEIEREPKRIMLAEQLRNGITARLPIVDAWEAWLNSPRKRRPSAETVEMYHAYWGRDEIKKHGRRGKNGFKNWLGWPSGTRRSPTCTKSRRPLPKNTQRNYGRAELHPGPTTARSSFCEACSRFCGRGPGS